jgi:putative sigma-54 modulation protein
MVDLRKEGGTMQLNITARHMELTEGLRGHIEKELKKLQRHFHKGADIQVRLHVEKYRHTAEVSCNVGGHLFQSTEETKDMYQSVDRAIESLGERYKRYKSKHWSSKGKAGLNDEALQMTSPDPEEEKESATRAGTPRIIRAQKYAVKPMSEEEAAMQMEVLGQEFIVYTDSKTEQVNVLYRRSDGNFGLIEPIYE